jgi:hypothetical protein
MAVKSFDWDVAKNAKLRAERSIGFEDSSSTLSAAICSRVPSPVRGEPWPANGRPSTPPNEKS